jgi:hypothetical protein
MRKLAPEPGDPPINARRLHGVRRHAGDCRLPGRSGRRIVMKDPERDLAELGRRIDPQRLAQDAHEEAGFAGEVPCQAERDLEIGGERPKSRVSPIGAAVPPFEHLVDRGATVGGQDHPIGRNRGAARASATAIPLAPSSITLRSSPASKRSPCRRRILRNCRDLPGSELFQYVGEGGACRSIDSGDVNDYLRAIAGAEITAKDFRTWAATNLALLALARRADTARRQPLLVPRAARATPDHCCAGSPLGLPPLRALAARAGTGGRRAMLAVHNERSLNQAWRSRGRLRCPQQAAPSHDRGAGGSM